MTPFPSRRILKEPMSPVLPVRYNGLTRLLLGFLVTSLRLTSISSKGVSSCDQVKCRTSRSSAAYYTLLRWWNRPALARCRCRSYRVFVNGRRRIIAITIGTPWFFADFEQLRKIWYRVVSVVCTPSLTSPTASGNRMFQRDELSLQCTLFIHFLQNRGYPLQSTGRC